LFSIIFILFSNGVVAQWWNPFAPDDYEECAKKSANKAKSDKALDILLSACSAEFPARRNPSQKGAYVYTSPETQDSYSVDMPNPDTVTIETAIEERRKVDTLAYEKVIKEEKERQIKAKQQKLINDIDKTKVTVPSYSASCTTPNCQTKSALILINNMASRKITQIKFGFVFYDSGYKVDCPRKYEPLRTIEVEIKPQTTYTHRFETSSGSRSNFRICAGITDVGFGDL
jgi:hypothetical protein